MPRNLTQTDAHAIMTELVKQATGRNNFAVVDTSSFVSAGEQLMASGYENVMNAISLLIGRTLIAARPYSGKLNIINSISTGVYSHRIRKISYYSRDPEASGDWNTQLYTNLADGYDNGTNSGNSTPNMWEQHQAIPVEFNFAGSDVWQFPITIYVDQLKQAFRDESSFNAFWAGVMTEHENDVESQKEAFRRMTMLNFIGGIANLGTAGVNFINLTSGFNTAFGTSYTTAQLLSGQYRQFYEYFISEVRKASDRMTDRTKNYHWSPTRTDGNVILRHTPKDRQRMIVYGPMFTDAEARVFPEIFNPNYIKEEYTEKVNFWQSSLTPGTVNVRPAIPVSNGAQTAGTAFNPDQMVAVLYDEDAMMVDFQLESALATSVEARKRYYNIWLSMARNSLTDFTENGIVFYMDDTP